MSQIRLINSMFEHDKRLEVEEARRAEHRNEPYVNYLAAPETREEEGNSIFARIFRRSKYGPESPTPVDFIEALQEFMHRN